MVENDKLCQIFICLTNLTVVNGHVQGTGVGKTVNRLSRLDGQLAQTAKSLVRQWRKLVKEGDDSQTLAKFQQETNTSNSKDCRQSKLKRQRVESTCNDINLSVSSIPGKDNDNASSFCHKKKRIEVGTVDEPVPIYTPNPGTIRGSRSEETSIYQRKRTGNIISKQADLTVVEFCIQHRRNMLEEFC